MANVIAEMVGAELFKVEQKVPYAADYDTCIAQPKKDLQERQGRGWFLAGQPGGVR